LTTKESFLDLKRDKFKSKFKSKEIIIKSIKSKIEGGYK